MMNERLGMNKPIFIGMSLEKTSTNVLTKYAHSSTNLAVTALCDQPQDRKLGKTILCTFGIGLSWGGAAIDLSKMYNGGIATYVPPPERESREEQIQHWLGSFSDRGS